MENLIYLLSPIVKFIYKFLIYIGWVDARTGMKLQTSGLKRLKMCSGYPTAWIFNDEKDSKEFNALLKTIKKHTKSTKLMGILDKGYIPSLITIGGSPCNIGGIDPNWQLHEKVFYSSNHPIMMAFGLPREGGKGKIVKACTIGELEKWIENDKQKTEFWIGAFVLTLISIGLIIVKISL